MNNFNTVSQEQLDVCTRWNHENTGETFYTVQSATSNNVYKVAWNKQYKVLQCTCIAAEHGHGCWHKRAVREAARLYREEVREQAQIEAYVRQGIDRETATRRVYAGGSGFTDEEQLISRKGVFGMKRNVVDLKSGDKVVVASGVKEFVKGQYRPDNVHVRLTFTDGSTLVLREFDQVEVAGNEPASKFTDEEMDILEQEAVMSEPFVFSE